MSKLVKMNSKNVELERKTLQKAAELGSKQVGKTLSQWTNKPVEVNTTTDLLSSSEEALSLLNPQKRSFFIYTGVKGDSSGVALVSLEEQGAFKLIDILTEKKIGTTTKLSENGKSALQETANLLSGSYLNALVKLAKKPLVASHPHFINVGEVKKAINYLRTQTNGKKGIVFVTELVIKPHKIKVELLLIFDEKLLNLLTKNDKQKLR